MKTDRKQFQPLLPKSPAVWLILTLFTLVACSKEEKPAPPVISGFELGYQNSHLAYAGSDLHIEADILAEGKIQHIILEIHPEEAHEEDQASGASGTSWEVDTTYAGKYSGVKNTTFHEHLGIPATADTGSYHVHFIVTDMEGNQTSLEEELHILLPADTTTPVIQVFFHSIKFIIEPTPKNHNAEKKCQHVPTRLKIKNTNL